LLDIYFHSGGPDFQDITIVGDTTTVWTEDVVSWSVYADQSTASARPQKFYMSGVRTGSQGVYVGTGDWTVYVSSWGYPGIGTPTATPGVAGSYCESVNSDAPASPFGYGSGEVVHNECAVFPGID